MPGPAFEGDERTVQLVAINGTARYRTTALMGADGPGLEQLAVGGEQRVLYLGQATEDPDVAAVSYADARAKLADALQNIKAMVLEQEHQHGPEARERFSISCGARPIRDSALSEPPIPLRMATAARTRA